LVLAAVFVVAGVAKLADRAGVREAIVEFGISARLVGPLVIFLPLAELAIASDLIPTATVWWGALREFALWLGFLVGIGINLARGNRPDCHFK
jgi:hypothetical protein